MLKIKKLYGMLAVLAIYGLSASFAHAIPIAGSSTGIFTNPIGPGGMIVTGVGTNSFTWGTL